MKIVKYLSNSMSAIIGYAVVEVEPNEDADIEKMLVLIDGDTVGHFGLQATLIGTGEWNPKWVVKDKNGVVRTVGQFGFQSASGMRQTSRFYRVMVNRD